MAPNLALAYRERGRREDALSRSHARLEHAHSLVEPGAALRRAGQRRAARDSRRSGHELAQRCGADALVARAEQELSASGARLVRRPLSGLEALTPSERRVATLAAQGLTNPQIAQSLFLSFKTVEMHSGAPTASSASPTAPSSQGGSGPRRIAPPEPLAEPV